MLKKAATVFVVTRDMEVVVVKPNGAASQREAGGMLSAWNGKKKKKIQRFYQNSAIWSHFVKVITLHWCCPYALQSI